MNRRKPALLFPLLVATLLAAGAARAARAELPQPALVDDCPLAEVGRGRLTFLGQVIYRASLWTDNGHFDARVRRCTALSLWYERAFTRSQLLKITTGELRRLALADAARIDTWRGALEKLWVDVAPGDNMTAVVTAGGPTRFYDRKGLRGQIDDPAFGPAYLAIWMDPRTRVTRLREDLLASGRG
jgi:hypothetical protein